MKIENKTHYDTKFLRKLIYAELKDFEFVDRIRVTILYRRGNRATTGMAGFGGRNMWLYLDKAGHKINDLISTIRHEALHSQGLGHKEFAQMHEEIPEQTANEIPLKPRKPKPTAEQLVGLRYENVLKKIKDKESRLKRIQNQLKKLYKRKRYYVKKKGKGII